jgi:hypothetical protein
MFKYGLVLVCLLSLLVPRIAHAQGAAPELFGVREVIVEYVKFSDAQAANTCGLTREEISADLAKAFEGTNVPAIAAVDAKPPSMGIARIELIPEISSHTDENLNCMSWISLSAESRSNTIISPINTLRSITVVYWRQHTTASSNQSYHPKLVDDVVTKMAQQFATQYRLDQPQDQPK